MDTVVSMSERALRGLAFEGVLRDGEFELVSSDLNLVLDLWASRRRV